MIKTADDVKTPRRHVEWFAEAMEERMRANDHKKGWQRDSLRALMQRLDQEVEELRHAVVLGGADVPNMILKEAADVANFAMMIADNAVREANARDSRQSAEGARRED